jgi:MFS transporter, OCT family, solute carrier family 22 (organic cation transporter), member 18
VQQLAKDGMDQNIPKTYAQLQSFFSIIQTVGSPLAGILLDRVGIRMTSALVFLSSAASYMILAGATSMPMLFVSKIPTALQHAFLVAQATAAVTSKDHSDLRAQALGRMTTAYTIGATVGPYLGGMLAERGDLYVGAKMAVMVSCGLGCWDV